jgi:tripartite-type tricarboxylate transporter receptor subunit TctC
VRLIIGYPAGAAADIVGRLLGQSLSERLGQQFVIESRSGANSNLATEAVAHAAEDGYTLLLAINSSAINATLYDKLNFNFIRDLVPVAGIARTPVVMVVHPSVPAKTLPEFIAYAKANPDRINMASAGIGNPTHMAGELFKAMSGVKMVPVHYRGGAPAFGDLLGGQVQVYFPAVIGAIEYIRSGQLRALAVGSAARVDLLPDIPTIGDFVPGYEASVWFGLNAPKGRSADVIVKLDNAVNMALGEAKFRARLADLGGVPMPMTPAEFGKLIVDDTERWAKVIRAAHLRAE